MAATYKYAKESISGGQNENIPTELHGDVMIDDDLMNSAGIYSKEDINTARFNNFSRFGRLLDPYGKVNAGREYLFFVKPDLHICIPDGNYASTIYSYSGGVSSSDIYTNNGLKLNPQLNQSPYFKDLIDFHPDVIKQLQTSVDSNPFSYLLSSSVSSNLPLDSSSAKTMDTPATIFGTTYNYLQDSEASDEAYSFSLEFVDDKYLDTYSFFKAYSEYHIARKSGLVTPPSLDYYRYRRLHNTMGIYKFVVGEDMETILYWAYLWGVIPTSCPREAFQDPSFTDGLTFSVNFEAAFIDDMNPRILSNFNTLMRKIGISSTNDWLPIVRQNIRNDMTFGTTHGYDPSIGFENGTEKTIAGMTYLMGPTDMINGKLPRAALVDGRRVGTESRLKYRLRWYA